MSVAYSWSRRVLALAARGPLPKLLTILLTIVFCTTSAGAAEVREAAKEADEIKLLYYGQKYGRLTFTYQRNNNSDIYILDFNSFTIEPLVLGSSSEERPRFSPDGRRVVFQSNRTGNHEIYVVDDAGTSAAQLTNVRKPSKQPDWSPDGAYIVFQGTADDARKSLYVINQDGGNLRRLTRARRSNSHPRWSPRGSELLYSSDEYWPGWDIVLYNINTRKSRLLTKGLKGFSRPAWHPSGASFALSYGAGKEIDIWQFEKGADQMTLLIEQAGREYDAEWIDEGKKLAFVGETEPGSGHFELFIWEKKTKKVHQITASGGSIRHPSWTALPSLKSIQEIYQDKLEEELSAN